MSGEDLINALIDRREKDEIAKAALETLQCLSAKNINLSLFGKFLRKWRLEHDVKAAFMAKAVGCSKTYLYSMEEGIRSPSDEMTARLADFMKLSEEDRHVMQLCIDQSRKVWMIDMTQFSQEARALLVAFVEGLKKGYGDARN